jgi:hypothetical protein
MRRLLSFCTNSAGEAVHLHSNLEGLKELRRRLDVLITSLEAGRVEHDHLFTEAWAGEELTATMLAQEASGGYRVVNEVKIFAWTPEWAEKHGLIARDPDD